MKNSLSDLIIDNPLMVRVLKPYSVLRNLGSVSSSNWIVVGIIILIYACLIGVAVKAADTFDAGVSLFVMLFIVCLSIPATLHGALAGEREKRTLDLMLVAPVTSMQIVVSKTAKALIPLFGIIVACVLPSIAVAIARHQLSLDATQGKSFYPVALSGTVLVTLAAGLMISGTTMYASSVSRTRASAMVSSLGILFVWLILVPIMASLFNPLSHEFSDMLVSYHPYVAIARMLYPGSDGDPTWPFLVSSTIINGVVGIGGLIATTRRLERERKTGGAVNA